jgi:hypothetical protein
MVNAPHTDFGEAFVVDKDASVDVRLLNIGDE